MRDLLVAGGGPVGLATALYAARAGLSVEVREPRAGVVDKACGEGLMPGAVAALAGLGVDPAGVPLAGIAYLDGRTRVEAAFASPGRGVRRTVLHAALAEAVAQAGIPVTARPVATVVQRAGHVEVDGEPVGHLVAADGLHSPVRRRLGLDAPVRRSPPRYGLRAHYRVAPWTGFVEVHWAPHAEAYVTPVGPELVGVAVLGGRAGRRPELLAGFPELARRLAGAAASPVRGAGPLRQRSRRRVAGRVLLVGDAAGYVDALTGEGIATGLAQARAAVAAIAAGDPGSYERAWRRATRRHAALTHALLAAARRPRVRSRLVPAAAALPWLFRAAVHELGGPA